MVWGQSRYALVSIQFDEEEENMKFLAVPIKWTFDFDKEGLFPCGFKFEA